MSEEQKKRSPSEDLVAAGLESHMHLDWKNQNENLRACTEGDRERRMIEEELTNRARNSISRRMEPGEWKLCSCSNSLLSWRRGRENVCYSF